jgi:hypothetical protein
MPRLLLSLFLAATLATPTLADASSTVLEKWYPALFAADGNALAALLADEAEIRLDDLGIVQSRAEFLESLDEWKESTDGASFDWKLDPDASVSESEATALVCYRFPSNEIMTRESFTIADGRITGSVQTTAADNCDGF